MNTVVNHLGYSTEPDDSQKYCFPKRATHIVARLTGQYFV